MNPLLTIPLWVWFVLLTLASLIAFFYYSGEHVWNKKKNTVLFVIRTVSLSLVFILLFSPKTEIKQPTIVEPIWIFLIDDSESIALKTPTTTINNLFNKIFDFKKSSQGLVKIQGFGYSSLDSIKKFKTKESDIALNLKKVEEKFHQNNVAGVILVSDGIYNKGISPLYQDYKFPIYTIGLGDTMQDKDISIKQIDFNRINYKNNAFPIKVRIKQYGFNNRQTSIKLFKDEKLLDTKVLQFGNAKNLFELDFTVSEEKEGTYTYTILVEPLNGEYTIANNKSTIILDVIESKEKILILSSYPHPDIRAIHESLVKNNNYEVKICIPEVFNYQDDTYNVVVAYQVPSMQDKKANKLLEKFIQKQIPICFFVGSDSDIENFNKIANSVILKPKSKEFDKVQGYIKNNFTIFLIEEEKKEFVNKMPPVAVPFADYILLQNSDVFIWQKVGNFVTDKPLWMVGHADETKNAIIFGEGWWKVKVFEKKEYQNSNFFDQAILKTVQYLSTKNDKSRFKIYPIQEEFSVSDVVIFSAELYNQVFEKIYGVKVNLEITNKKTKEKFSYEFIPSAFNSNLEIGNLPPGNYIYEATTFLDNKKESVKGKFHVIETHLEQLNLTADHELLRNLAQSNGGFFTKANQLDDFFIKLSKIKPNKKIKYTQIVKDSIYLWPLLIFSLIGFCTEWFLRKWWGSY